MAASTIRTSLSLDRFVDHVANALEEHIPRQLSEGVDAGDGFFVGFNLSRRRGGMTVRRSNTEAGVTRVSMVVEGPVSVKKKKIGFAFTDVQITVTGSISLTLRPDWSLAITCSPIAITIPQPLIVVLVAPLISGLLGLRGAPVMTPFNVPSPLIEAFVRDTVQPRVNTALQQQITPLQQRILPLIQQVWTRTLQTPINVANNMVLHVNPTGVSVRPFEITPAGTLTTWLSLSCNPQLYIIRGVTPPAPIPIPLPNLVDADPNAGNQFHLRVPVNVSFDSLTTLVDDAEPDGFVIDTVRITNLRFNASPHGAQHISVVAHLSHGLVGVDLVFDGFVSYNATHHTLSITNLTLHAADNPLMNWLQRLMVQGGVMVLRTQLLQRISHAVQNIPLEQHLQTLHTQVNQAINALSTTQVTLSCTIQQLGCTGITVDQNGINAMFTSTGTCSVSIAL